MNVPDDAKLAVLVTMFGPLFGKLAESATVKGQEPPEVTADDIVDYLAMAIATVIENDSNLTTPRHVRLAVETTAKRITARVRDIREYREMHGQSLSSSILGNAVAAGATVN